jgi:transcription-repair coupling factor (superfamily II helicase)
MDHPMSVQLMQALGQSPAIDDRNQKCIEIAAPATALALGYRGRTRFLLVVTHSSRAESEIATSLRSLLGEDSVAQFPAWETLPHERLSPQSDTVAKRVKTRHLLEEIQRGGQSKVRVVVTQVRALLQPVIISEEVKALLLATGSEQSQSEIIEALIAMAYQRVDLVERRGEFAVRGGLIDIFPTDREHPIRVDLFGDEIEEIRLFSVSDQRSMDQVIDQIELLPARELLITAAVKQRALAVAERFDEVREMASRIASGAYIEGMESISSLLADKLAPLHQLMPDSCEVIFVESARVRSRALDLQKTDEEFLEAAWSSAANGGQTPLDLREVLRGSSFLTLDQVIESMEMSGITTRNFDSYPSEDSSQAWAISPVSNYKGNSERLIADLKGWRDQGFSIFVGAQGSGLLKRYDELISEHLPTTFLKERASSLTAGVVHLVKTPLRTGFIAVEAKVVFLTDRDIAGRGSGDPALIDTARLPSRRRKEIDPLSLKRGDFVVHEQHGIGRFIELVTRTVAGAQREYLVIEYAPARRGLAGDRIFVPTDALDAISKYIGGESPTVHRIGGSDWIKSKARAKKAIRDIAKELIKVYAARVSMPGYAFSPDTTWQRELEDAFAYVETPDQISTIEDVKRDMESDRPMDRLVCGDVGYGKTEIAVRAAFKAIQDGKQVAILVPTTLLVQQHFATFTARYAGFPVRVAALSRFNSPSESKEVLRGLAAGSVDLVIGTHRLLSKDVVFKDLGLVVIDEEQRFGVEHKEALKHMRASIDVLAMSATPIPRTLEMAITGIREMSTITTPPEERHPILTFVGPADPKQITAAIHRELLREGQVFYLHNRVESIDEVAARLRRLVPEARIAVAHGQMSEVALEEVVLAFWNREFDVLVSTTIIENGIDVANANTLIVERADLFGLSQLHQLRGRVGRSRERAYAYFLYDPNRPLSELAHDRLTTIATNTDLGSGMQVALKDLEIRGAGNLLGGEQSGHIADVGFDLYMRMVGETVEEMKIALGSKMRNEPVQRECKVELPVTAHIPDEYVTADRLRLDLYRRLASSHRDEEIDEIENEMRDRFGQLPVQALRLLSVARVRNRVRDLGITEVLWQTHHVKLSSVSLAESKELKIKRLYPGSIYKPQSQVLLVTHNLDGWLATMSAPRSASDKVALGDASENQDRELVILQWLENLLHSFSQ